MEHIYNRFMELMSDYSPDVAFRKLYDEINILDPDDFDKAMSIFNKIYGLDNPVYNIEYPSSELNKFLAEFEVL